MTLLKCALDAFGKSIYACGRAFRLSFVAAVTWLVLPSISIRSKSNT